MKAINVDFAKTEKYAPETQYLQAKENVLSAFKTLTEKTGAGAEFTGWVDLPVAYDKEEVARIKKCAEKIRKDSDVLVVCGIGGSYLGAAAALDFLKGGMYNFKTDGGPQIFFAGNNMSSSYIMDVLDRLEGKDFSVNVISKSGTTMETSIAFRIFKKALEDKYGKEEAARRIYATTDKQRGALKQLADSEGYEEFVVPDDIGGRFSVLTAVGLLPIAVAGGDLDELFAGAQAMREYALNTKFEENVVLRYAWTRQKLYGMGKDIEIFANYEPDLRNIGEWLKQLFGESEGKDGMGIFPASVSLTTDLHSMGQLIQDGKRNIFETIIFVENALRDVEIPEFDEDFDGYKYLEHLPVGALNLAAFVGTSDAHEAGNVPQIAIGMEDRSEANLGQLFYFFEFVCGISAYIEGVNPFNQPGVEEYKKNIRKILAEK
ncbi:MAG: glucose-6-phosphate isomerase [Lachnospiraceae bacterium]|nr:glucose-6-phosphate isomerase [Lachnospiraceae bacterium]